MKNQYNYARPFPKGILTFLLLAIAAYFVYSVGIKPDLSALRDRFTAFGKIICKYDVAFISVILIFNAVELVDFFVFAKRDEIINANFEYLQGHIGIRTFFKQYFAPMFTTGPYIFASEERNSALWRKLSNGIVGLVKYFCWLVAISVFVTAGANADFRAFLAESNPDYLYTLLILFACVNCNIFLFVLYRITPLYESRSYDLITYYSDGTTTTRTENRSNFIAMILLSAIVYVLFSAFYFTVFSQKLVRSIETSRFVRFADRQENHHSILSFYREK